MKHKDTIRLSILLCCLTTLPRKPTLLIPGVPKSGYLFYDYFGKCTPIINTVFIVTTVNARRIIITFCLPPHLYLMATLSRKTNTTANMLILMLHVCLFDAGGPSRVTQANHIINAVT